MTAKSVRTALGSCAHILVSERSGLLFSSLLNFCFLAAGMSIPAGTVDTSLSDIFLRLPPGSCRRGRASRHTAVKQAPAGACRKAAAAATAAAPHCRKPRPAAEAGVRATPPCWKRGARARPPAASGPSCPRSRLALFPPPSRQFARSGCGIRRLPRGGYFNVPLPRDRLKGEAELWRGVPLTPSSFQRRFNRNWPNPSIPRPRCEDSKVCGMDGPTRVRGRGGQALSRLTVRASVPSVLHLELEE